MNGSSLSATVLLAVLAVTSASTNVSGRTGSNILTQCPTTGSQNVHLPHESDCSLFYQCDNGKKVLKECAAGLHFNAILEVCDWPKSAKCTLGESSDSGSSTSSSSTTGSSDSVSSTTSSSVSSSSTTETGIPTECPADFESDNVHLAHESDCGLFYHCAFGEKVEKKCPAGLHFNPVLQVCDWPEFAGCTVSDSDNSDDSVASSSVSSSSTTESSVPSSSTTESSAPSGSTTESSVPSSSTTESSVPSSSTTGSSVPSSSTTASSVPSSSTTESSVPSSSTTESSVPSSSTTESSVPSSSTTESSVPSSSTTESSVPSSSTTESSVPSSSTTESSVPSSSTTESSVPSSSTTENSVPSSSTTESSVPSSPTTESSIPSIPTTETEATVPTECPAEFENENVHLAHEYNCSLFYQCVFGEKIVRECPAGLHFNPVLQVCDWPESAGCSPGGSGDSESSTPGSSSTGSPDSGSSTDSGSGSTEAGVTIPTECPSDFENENVHLAHEYNCSLFYQCVFGEKIERECPAGLHFNAVLQVCDWPESAGCDPSGGDNSGSSSTASPTESTETESQSSGAGSDSTDIPTESTETESESSGDGSSTSSPSETTPAESSEWDSSEWEGGDDINTTENPAESTESEWDSGADNSSTDGSGSGSTEAGVTIPTECPSDFENENVHLAHEYNCSLFYQCVFGEKIERECPAGLHFNPVLQVCDWPESAGCSPGGSGDSESSTPGSSSTGSPDSGSSTDSGSGSTEAGVTIPTECPSDFENENVHLAHEYNCSLFYQCVFGEKIERECPAGLHFNAVLQVCDWPESAGCDPSGGDNSGSTSTGSPTESTGTVSESSGDESSTSSSTETTPAESSEWDDGEWDSNEHIDSTEDPTESPENDSGSTEGNSDTGSPTESTGTESGSSEDSESTDNSVESAEENTSEENNTDRPDVGTTSSSPDSGSTEAGVTIPTECPSDFENENVHLAHEYNCSLFYQCVFGEKIERECPAGLHFNPVLQVCDWPESAGCSPGGSGDSESSTPGSSSTGSPDSGSSTDSGSGSTEAGVTIPTECPSDFENENVHLAHEYNCSLFYQCVFGEKIERECPAGLHFNAVLQVCDWPESAGCDPSGGDNSGSSSTGSPTESTGTESESSGDGSSTTSPSETTPADSSEWDSGEWDSGEHIDSTEDPTESSESDSESTEGNSSTGSSTESTETDSGSSEDSDSTDNSVESTEENTSVENNTDGSDVGTTSSSPDSGSTEAEVTIPTECPSDFENENVHLAHEYNCNLFYQCVFGAKIERECPAGLHFNPVLQVCDWPASAGCDLSGGNDSESSTPGSSTTGGPDSGSSTDSGSGSPEAGVTVPTECPSDFGSDNVHLAHEYNCSLFYQCVFGEKIERECPPGLHFNAILQVCDWPESAGCTPGGTDHLDSSEWNSSEWDSDADIDTTDESGSVIGSTTESGWGITDYNSTETEPPTTVFPDRENCEHSERCPYEDPLDYTVILAHIDCTKFCKCSNGAPYVYDCPKGLYFNDGLKVCDWSEVSGCIQK